MWKIISYLTNLYVLKYDKLYWYPQNVLGFSRMLHVEKIFRLTL